MEQVAYPEGHMIRHVQKLPQGFPSFDYLKPDQKAQGFRTRSVATLQDAAQANILRFVREADIGRSLVGDDAVRAFAAFFVVFSVKV
jgi:hypothetical protein